MSIIGTKALPPGYLYLLESARKAKAYHALDPYPKYGFKSWKTETRGPVPKCYPFVRKIVRQSAVWLFGKPVSFTADGDDKAAEFLNEAWSQNRMPGRSVAMAELGGQSGGVVLKGSWDPELAEKSDDKNGLRINVLDAVEHCRLYYDQRDSTKLIMARIQYPYLDYETNKWFLYREDWDDQEEVHYDPVPIPGADSNDPVYPMIRQEVEDKFVETSRDKNPFGVIPLVQIKNIEAGYWHGVGDLWRLYAAIDGLNLTYDLAHKDDQTAVFPHKVYIDVAPRADDAPIEDGPGAVEDLTSDGDHPDVKLLETQGRIREYLENYAQEVKAQIYDAAGSVEIRPGEVTNHGSLTSSVMNFLFRPLIEQTDQKRQSYGEDGIAKFLETMLAGCNNAGFINFGNGTDVSVVWPDHFTPTEEEMGLKGKRLVQMVEGGLMKQKDAAREVAMDSGVTDVVEYLEGLPAPATARNTAEERKNGKNDR